jgi:acetyltransferase-like isoleucine patch superfamily enzyme
MVLRIILKLGGLWRVIFWKMLTNFKCPLGSTVGPYSIARISGGGSFVCKGVLHARDTFRLNIVGGKVTVAGRVFFNSYVSISSVQSVEIGEGCLFGENVKIYDHDHEYGHGIKVIGSGLVSKPVKIGNNVWIGSNVVILKGVSIGDNSVIGAGTIVTKDIEANAVHYHKTTPVRRCIQ